MRRRAGTLGGAIAVVVSNVEAAPGLEPRAPRRDPRRLSAITAARPAEDHDR